jgi:hypothetical protein
MAIIEELKWRGLYADCTDLEALTKRLASGPADLYCGFDPRATRSTWAASWASSRSGASSWRDTTPSPLPAAPRA